GDCYEYKWFSSSRPNSNPPVIWCQRSDGLNVTGGCPAINPPVDNSSCDPTCLMPKSFCSEVTLFKFFYQNKNESKYLLESTVKSVG
ncbi:hypothetical protein XENOCAPTIV_014093, partial [Xenoophorus captivus]